MITVRLTGGLGNQCLQFATGRAAALRLGTGLRLNTSWYDRTSQSHIHWKPYCLDQWAGVSAELTKEDSGIGIQETKTGVYDSELVSRMTTDCTLSGHWFTEKYFNRPESSCFKILFRNNCPSTHKRCWQRFKRRETAA